MRQIVLRMLAPIHIKLDDDAIFAIAEANNTSEENIKSMSDDDLIDAVAGALESDLNNLSVIDQIDADSFEISIATGRPGLGITQEK